MKKSVNCEFLGGGKELYHTPEIEMYESVVERGFETSPWGEEGYTGILNYDEPNNDMDI